MVVLILILILIGLVFVEVVGLIVRSFLLLFGFQFFIFLFFLRYLINLIMFEGGIIRVLRFLGVFVFLGVFI